MSTKAQKDILNRFIANAPFTKPDPADAHAFKKIFNRSLYAFWHPIFKFDVVAFDRFIGPPDGVSTADQVLQDYGKDALDLCRKLLK